MSLLTAGAAFAIVTVQAATGATDSPNLVGVVPVGCGSVTRDSAPAQTPTGFTISPDQAVKIAVAKAKFRCNNIFEQAMYADARNYYIVTSVTALTNEQITSSIVIDGRSGKLMDRRKK